MVNWLHSQVFLRLFPSFWIRLLSDSWIRWLPQAWIRTIIGTFVACRTLVIPGTIVGQSERHKLILGFLVLVFKYSLAKLNRHTLLHFACFQLPLCLLKYTSAFKHEANGHYRILLNNHFNIGDQPLVQLEFVHSKRSQFLINLRSFDCQL